MAERGNGGGGLAVLQAIDHARKEGWTLGYRAGLGDVERLWESRGGELADVRELVADLREDAADIAGRKYGAADPSREKLAGDRRRAIAAARGRGLSLAEIAAQFGISKSYAGKLLARAARDETVSFSSPRRRIGDGAR